MSRRVAPEIDMGAVAAMLAAERPAAADKRPTAPRRTAVDDMRELAPEAVPAGLVDERPPTITTDGALLAAHAAWLGDEAHGRRLALRAALLSGQPTGPIRGELSAIEVELLDTIAAEGRLAAEAEAAREATLAAELAVRAHEIAAAVAQHQAARLAALQPPPWPVLIDRNAGRGA